ncbi:hypothetical protein [Pseudaminobacter soli (ex Li et al. 2025)]|uniref:Uncharacterized protein n=1 Tax=Pseudaminobacter soli (ex Li et al. 2025) TaxID=1295366 RepID=A0A2P7RZU7_9HYPH|nr:hypothetical protein [Mesorhizobium soli]PSJ55755.1 hypothetical protein C7I85_26045 [Mesorhizobium soli]
MTEVYRTDGPWGLGKGSNLTPGEVDANFWGLTQRVAELLADIPAPVNISNIDVSGTQMKIFLEDGRQFGPFTLPQANFRPSVVGLVAAATFAPVLTDSNCYKRCTNAGGCVVTVPTNASVAFTVDTEISFRQVADGPVSFIGAAGVLIHPVRGFLHQTAQQGATVSLKKVATNEWEVTGWLAPEPEE